MHNGAIAGFRSVKRELALAVDPELFPDETVWSSYGAGYGWLPLVLPFVGLAWLWYTRPRT